MARIDESNNRPPGIELENAFDPDGVHLQICKPTLRGEYNDWK